MATMEWKAEAYKALGVEPNLAKAIAANPGFATTPQAVQKQAQPIVNASKDVMGASDEDDGRRPQKRRT